MTKQEINQVIKRRDELKELLAEFGLVLGGFDPGVMGHLVQDGVIVWTYSFGGPEWEWLEPLLIELKERRGKE